MELILPVPIWTALYERFQVHYKKVVHYGDMYGISQHPNLASDSQHSLSEMVGKLTSLLWMCHFLV